MVIGRGVVFAPEDNSTDCDADDQTDDSICRGYGISFVTNPQNIKFEIFSTRIHENQRKQHVVSIDRTVATDFSEFLNHCKIIAITQITNITEIHDCIISLQLKYSSAPVVK